MKRRLLVLSISALLGISLMASCGPEKPSSSESIPSTSDVTTSQPATSETTESSEAPAVEIGISAAKSQIELGESTKLTVTLKNATADTEVSVSSESEAVRIYQENDVIYAHGVKPGEAKIVATAGEAKAEVTVKVVAPAPLQGQEASAALKGVFEAAILTEGTNIVSGTYVETSATKDGTLTQNDTHNFNVYSDKKVVITTTKGVGSSKKTINTTYGQAEGSLVIYQTETTESGTKESYGTKSVAIKENPTYKDISQADADKYCGLVDINASGMLTKAGIINNFYLANIKSAGLYNKETVIDSVKLERLTMDTYKATSTGFTGYNFETGTLVFKLDAAANITSIDYTLEKYIADKTGETPVKGDLSTTYTVKAAINAGERTASPETVLDLNKLYHTSYDVELTNDGTALTEAHVGDTIDVGVKNPVPATASAKIDPVTIKSVAPADAAEISYNKTSITLLKPTETLTVTTTTAKGVEKTATLIVKQGVVNIIEVFGIEGDLAVGVEHELSISVDPYTLEEAAAVTLTITDATNDAVATYNEDYGVWTVSATTAGTATLNVTSALYVDENGEQIVDTYSLNFVEGSAVSEESIAANMLGMWALRMGSGDPDSFYMFTQSPEQEGTSEGYFVIHHYGDGATGSFWIYYDFINDMYAIGFELDQGCKLNITEMYFTMDMETGTLTYKNITIVATDSFNEEVNIDLVQPIYE